MCYARAYPWSQNKPAFYANTPEKLASELEKIEICPPLYLSQITDPLQPNRMVRETTAKVVEVAIRFGVAFHLITKSGEGLFWLLKRVPSLREYPHWWLSITIEAPPEKQKVTSPFASPVWERLAAAEECAKAGIFVVVRTDPAIWGLVHEEDEIWILDRARDAGARHIVSALGHFNRVSFGRLVEALSRFGFKKEASEVLATYRPQEKEGFFPRAVIRAPLSLRQKFHRFMRQEAEKRGMTYSACLEMGREWDSPGIPHCEAAPQGRLSKKDPSGKFSLLDNCYADCLRNCPDPLRPPCGRRELLQQYPYKFSTLLPRPLG